MPGIRELGNDLKPQAEAEVRVVSELFGMRSPALRFERSASHSFTVYKRLVFFCVHPSRPNLLEKIETGWDQLNESELLSIETTWMPAAANNRIFDARSRLSLTWEELEFLRQHPVVHLGASPWEPLTIVDEHGNYSGIALDLLARHLQILGVTPIFNGSPEWPDVVSDLEQGKYQGLGYAVPTEEREASYSVSHPYVYAPLVVVSREGEILEDSIESLRGKRFGLDKKFTVGTQFEWNRPDIQLIEFDDRKLAALALERGEIDGWLEIAPTARKVAAELGIDSFQVAFRTDLVDGMSLILVPELDPLCHLFDRAVDSTSNESINSIYSKYEPVFREPPNRVPFWLIAGLLMLLVGMSLVSFRLFSAVRRSRREIQLNEQKLRHAQRVSRSGSLEYDQDRRLIRMIGETHWLFEGAAPGLVESLEDHVARMEKTAGIQLRQAISHEKVRELELQFRNGQILRYDFCKNSAEVNAPRLVTVQDVTERVRRDPGAGSTE